MGVSEEEVDAANPALDFSGREQLYRQLYDILFQDIINGVYAVGDLIPSESDLMQRYGVSRATARKSMEMLSNNGMITKRRGVGSVVVSDRPNTSLSRVTSVIKKNVDDRVAPVKRLLDAMIVPADPDTARALDIPEKSEVYQLRRVRCSGDDPGYLEIIRCERAFLDSPLSRDFSRESWRSYLINDLGVRWSRAVQSVFSKVADEFQAGILHIKPGDPLLSIERISYDARGVPREVVQTCYRADRYHLEIVLDA